MTNNRNGGIEVNSPISVPERRGPRLWPQKRRWQVVFTSLILFILVICAAFGYGYWILHKKLPVTSGTLSIPGLHASVSVYRDPEGVPHIEAKNEHDLFLAQGFVTAQSRLFQMDLSRRQASGTLSEIAGSATVSQDKFFRTLGLRRWAKKSYASYSMHSQDVLQWYSDGVNAFINRAEKKGKLPAGFQMLSYKPSPWTPTDSLTIGKYMAYDLGGHWQGQAFRYYLLEHFSKKKAMALFPSYPNLAPTILQTARNNPIQIEKSLAAAAPVLPNPFNGSNNWVVSGKKTASGKPYLANDPHLSLATPSIWYETNLKAPGINVSGVIFAGVPGIIIGHNQSIAWGVTNVGPDVQDLYIEKRNPKHPNEFLYEGKWYKAKVIHEKIRIKGGKTIHYQVTVTKHGPVVSQFAHDSHAETVLAMKWTALQPTTELEAVLKFMKAKNWNEFKKALTYFQAPAQNFVFASKEGTIAYRANGLIPIRKNGNSLLPVPGWTDKYEWTGYIPWDQLPMTVNPPDGFIATANNKVTPADYPFHISNTWEEPFRAERIRQVLTSKNHFNIKDMKALQFDHKNLKAVQFLPKLLPVLKQNQSHLRPIDKKAMSLLENWNRDDNKNLSAPLIFNLWMAEFPKVLFDGQISPKMISLFENKEQVTDQLIMKAGEGDPGPWVEGAGGWNRVVHQSFRKAVSRAEQLQGKNPSKWVWGQFHKVQFPNPLSAKKPLNLLFNPKPRPVSGSCVTVAAACWNHKTGEVNHGPAWRMIIDMADPDKNWGVVAPGQSGHVLSRWYANQIDDWVMGHYHVTSIRGSSYRPRSAKLTLTGNKSKK